MRSGKTHQPMIIFSLLDGHVWASWPGTDASVNLGVQEEVTEMMSDFLAQCDLGERLADRHVAND